MMDSTDVISIHVGLADVLDSRQIGKELYIAIKENQLRGLIENQVFFAEMLDCLKYKFKRNEVEWQPPTERVTLIKHLQALMGLEEWSRVEYHSKSLDTPVIGFMHFWARYQKAEIDARCLRSATCLPFTRYENKKAFSNVLDDLLAYTDHRNDGYLNYIRARLLFRLRRIPDAREALLTSINQTPYNWLAWSFLPKFVDSKETLAEISVLLYRHWLKRLFIAEARGRILPFTQDEDVTAIYAEMLDTFRGSPYILTQMAIQQQNQRQVFSAIELFRQIRVLDPYRLDHLDVLSNLLYVWNSESELTYLAHFCIEVDKYRKETCAVIANYLSLRGQHDKAIAYYRRALTLDPEYAQGWTLMGHEGLQIRNTCLAMEAYRNATAIDPRDYHAWYGLGQLFEVMKMPYFALTYHRKAYALRPTDSRIIVAMADCYQKLGEMDDAKKCYYKAYQTGDIEGMVLFNLAKLHKQLGEKELARECYRKFLEECEERKLDDAEELGEALVYLAKAFFEEGKLDESLENAQKAFNYPLCREESKMVIKQVSVARGAEAAAGVSTFRARHSTSRDGSLISRTGASSLPTFKFSTP
ncbi:cell division cycle protein 23 homolog isoform X2 [Varroa jacobsoni]|uniref:cell division cycle protein 23 homolog isoform X2 n=1 Tax=Varroa jacobsoni TaxID=62625 RepID=UPI000BFA2521|nr:cell division cycle protein 23 homolog isoform X2 [Varroa jacobsoni]